MTLSGSEDSDDHGDDIPDPPAAVSGPIEDRQTPLARLTKLEFLHNEKRVDAEQYMSILEFLPALEITDIPTVDSSQRDVTLRMAESFNIDPMLEGFEFEMSETYWITNNWPNLKVIELFSKRRVKKWKKNQMAGMIKAMLPELKITMP